MLVTKRTPRVTAPTDPISIVGTTQRRRQEARRSETRRSDNTTVKAYGRVYPGCRAMVFSNVRQVLILSQYWSRIDDKFRMTKKTTVMREQVGPTFRQISGFWL